jgi:hypothetical protein
VGVYGDLEAVFSYVAPGADGVADDGDVVVCHGAEGGAESQDGRLIVCGLGRLSCEEGSWIGSTKVRKEANIVSWDIVELDGWICLIIVIRLARNENGSEKKW